MASEPTILRRYTPPTCRLELIAKSSPLSRWAGQPVLKNLRFRLSFDDPRLPDEQQLMLKGDRTQLENLAQAVETYLQTFLAASPARLNAALLAPLVDPEVPTEAIAPPPEIATPPESTPTVVTGDIFLQPNGLMTHDLHLGSLATPESGSIIPLSVLQLFDLASALDEYQADVVALPTLARPQRFSGVSPSLRFAASLLLAVGITSFSVKLLGDWYSTPEPTLTAAGDPQDPQQLLIRPAPTILPSPESSDQTLPPPPPMGASQPAAPDELISIPSGASPNAPSVSESTPELGGSESQIPVFDIPDEPVAQAPVPAPPRVAESAPAPAVTELPEVPEVAPSDSSPGDSGAVSRSAIPSTRSLQEPPAQTATAFDRIPQVAEVRRYFQQRWNPPESLPSTIEYSLLLAPDGSIEQVIPLGETAATFLDRTEMPLRGEAFVSPVEGGRQPKIRLVLTPEGEVQAFLEAMN